MAHIRAPLLGDPVYGGRPKLPAAPSAELRAALQGLRRQALHATRLRLAHPATGAALEFRERARARSRARARAACAPMRRERRDERGRVRARLARAAERPCLGHGARRRRERATRYGAESRDARGRRRRTRSRPIAAAYARQLALPAEPSWLEQVHGARVLDLDREQMAPADGAVTTRAGVVCAVLTADCLPVVLLRPRRAARRRRPRRLARAARRRAAGGRRGAFARIRPRSWLGSGPAIGPAAYEVGADVRDAFVARQPGRGTLVRAATPAAAGRPTSMASRATRWRRPACGRARRRVLHVHRGRAVLLAPARGSVRPHGDADHGSTRVRVRT